MVIFRKQFIPIMTQGHALRLVANDFALRARKEPPFLVDWLAGPVSHATLQRAVRLLKRRGILESTCTWTRWRIQLPPEAEAAYLQELATA
ncbi:MAG: hypothetical protein ABSG38_16115 [Spirochaetia bacterium]|jgi:hypothetical protein